MNPEGHIYMDDEDKIPSEDKARLDGYLRGRAEEGGSAADLKAKVERQSAVVAQMSQSDAPRRTPAEIDHRRAEAITQADAILVDVLCGASTELLRKARGLLAEWRLETDR
jgi:hypothetical protein